MAKVNVNIADRAELVDVAGLRPEVAEAILEFRGKHGRIADADALGELPGIGPATIEQVRKSLSFAEANGGAGPAREPVDPGPQAGSGATWGGPLLVEGAAEMGRLWVDLADAQARHNLEAWTEFAEAVDWDRVLRAYGELLHSNLEQTAQLTQRYLQVTQAMLVAASEPVPAPDRKAA